VPVEPARRAVLAASAAALPLLVVGCRGLQVLGPPPPPPAAVATLRSAIATEQGLLASYTAALAQPASGRAADRKAAAALAAVRAEHAAHLAELRKRLVLGPADAPAPSPRPTPLLPTGQAPTLAALEQAEQAFSDRLTTELAGLPPSLAQLFASIAASEATHVPFLRSAGRAR
jgi:hypothetical protein